MSTGWRTAIRAWQVNAIGAVALVVMLLGFFTLVVQPALGRRASARAQAIELAARRDEVVRLRASRQDTETRLASVRRIVAEQSVKLESRAHVNQRLDRLTVLANACGVQVGKLSPGATADASRHGTMSLRFTGTAPYDACQLFIAGLHRTFNDTALTTLRLAATPGSPGPVTMELDLLWFTAPDVRAGAQK